MIVHRDDTSDLDSDPELHPSGSDEPGDKEDDPKSCSRLSSRRATDFSQVRWVNAKIIKAIDYFRKYCNNLWLGNEHPQSLQKYLTYLNTY